MAETIGGNRAVVRMCAWTRQLELDGEWVSFEEYLEKRFGLIVSHGICDDAMQRLVAGQQQAIT